MPCLLMGLYCSVVAGVAFPLVGHHRVSTLGEASRGVGCAIVLSNAFWYGSLFSVFGDIIILNSLTSQVAHLLPERHARRRSGRLSHVSGCVLAIEPRQPAGCLARARGGVFCLF